MNNVVQNGQNNELVYNLPSSVNFSGCEICLSQATLFYCWENISASTYNNNIFSYSWLNSAGTGYDVFQIIIPDGLYSIAQIYQFAMYTMINNNHYAVQENADGSESNVFYWDMAVNETLYAIQVNTFNVATSPPDGITYKFAAPVTQFNPLVSFPQNFNNIVGFSAGFTTSISNAGTTLSFTSSVAPQVQPSPSLLLSVSSVNNQYNVDPSILPCDVGSQITVSPYPMFSPLLGGMYNQIRVRLLNSSYKPIPLQDPNMVIILTIRKTGQTST
jgi:hypothetical protein